MATKYVLQQKGNPQKRDDPKKWYAVPVSEEPLDEDAMTRTATAETTFSDVELGGSSKLIARHVLGQLLNGQRARVPGLGTFRLTFGSEGVADINDFKPSMIRNPRISFIADADLRADLLKELTYTNAGVREGDIYYADMTSYRKAKGIGTGGSGTQPGDGDDEGGQSGNPL